MEAFLYQKKKKKNAAPCHETNRYSSFYELNGFGGDGAQGVSLKSLMSCEFFLKMRVTKKNVPR